MSVLALVLATLPARAENTGPTFVGSPQLVTLARRIWPQLVGCTPIEPYVAPVVELRFANMPLAGRAISDGDLRFVAVDVNDGLPAARLPYTISHELGHFFRSTAGGDEFFFREGRAELLAMCVAEALPELVVPTARPCHMAVWDPQDIARLGTPAAGPAYCLAGRLMVALDAHVPRATLFELQTFPQLWSTVRRLAPEAREDALAALGPAVHTVDVDHDGVVHAAELAAGTDPWDPDSDDDGRWDGATAPQGRGWVGVWVPEEGCTLSLAGRRRHLELEVRGEVEAQVLPVPRLGGPRVLPEEVQVRRMPGDGPSGAWVRVQGARLEGECAVPR